MGEWFVGVYWLGGHKPGIEDGWMVRYTMLRLDALQLLLSGRLI